MIAGKFRGAAGRRAWFQSLAVAAGISLEEAEVLSPAVIAEMVRKRWRS